MSNNGAPEMKAGSTEGGEDDKYNGVGLVEISEIIVKQNIFFSGTAPFDRV